MPRSGRSEGAFQFITVLMIAGGVGYGLLRLALALSSDFGDSKTLTALASALLIFWLLVLLLWTVLLTARLVKQRARLRRRQFDASTSSRQTRQSTMQTQWKQPDPGATWANTHHDTRERTTSAERNSNITWWTENSSQLNSLQIDSLQTHTIAPNSEFRHVHSPICWSLELLQELEWHRFEEIAAGFFRSIGLDARPLAKGPDHEINLEIWQGGDAQMHAVARTRSAAPVIDIDQIRALYAVMTRDKLKQAFYLTSGRFTAEAVNAARGIGVFPIDGASMLKRIVSLPPAQQESLLQLAVRGDYRSPTCPACGLKMALRSGDFKSFWRCTGYPACKCRMVLAAEPKGNPA